MAGTRGGPPAKLTGKMRVRSLESPWWTQVASFLLSLPDMDGRTISVEELSQMVPSYSDGRRPRPRTVARRLSSILELVSRGPNGSRGRGATYRIRRPEDVPSIARSDVGDVGITSDSEWLLEQVERMIGNSRRRKGK